MLQIACRAGTSISHNVPGRSQRCVIRVNWTSYVMYWSSYLPTVCACVVNYCRLKNVWFGHLHRLLWSLRGFSRICYICWKGSDQLSDIDGVRMIKDLTMMVMRYLPAASFAFIPEFQELGLFIGFIHWMRTHPIKGIFKEFQLFRSIVETWRWCADLWMSQGIFLYIEDASHLSRLVLIWT